MHKHMHLCTYPDKTSMTPGSDPPSSHASSAASGAAVWNQVLPVQFSTAHFNLPQSVPHYPAVPVKYPVCCCCMRAQTDAAGMAEQV